MKKYMVLYYTPAEVAAQSANTSAEDLAKGMQAWAEWAEDCGENLLDMGSPLQTGEEITSEGNRTSISKVSGYSILQAESKEDALALLEDHPHLASHPEATIVLHEEMPMPEAM